MPKPSTPPMPTSPTATSPWLWNTPGTVTLYAIGLDVYLVFMTPSSTTEIKGSCLCIPSQQAAGHPSNNSGQGKSHIGIKYYIVRARRIPMISPAATGFPWHVCRYNVVQKTKPSCSALKMLRNWISDVGQHFKSLKIQGLDLVCCIRESPWDLFHFTYSL